ncbi:leucyl/phenylalanyl-tRNA--protein transferase [Campylobacter corcagiensis]|uniref:Leucyl/phenylalanyl-tRNA--protein transferase n=1 Tax=Campylobacter corcagiensis TaxID=1448857 RepID=A0A7M1LEQ5_9BACT|nr:leucyl/phenylalanyl-tRNA--protein transferase [Campylobacter corcagiensis]QKF65026.1 leucyl, phenylalanyl-tRNA-protein transferase [Campylobacter corcagiensis]QOQ86821.1 leucyl/phenylalanyl-tRNA--protein transferase [Campylobacter corcagiensis]
MKSFKFPDPNLAPADSPCVIGGNLSPKMLLDAYKSGYFPWFMQDQPVLWWSPDPRAVFFPEDVKLHKSTKPFLKKYNVKFSQNFKDLITLCFNQRVKNEPTWLSKDIINAYINLANLGYANSVEVYDEDELIGGLYGVMIGRVFCGESMISMKKEASKVALYTLAKALMPYDFIIDAQVMNPHLKFMGARNLDRAEFIKIYKDKINSDFTLNFKELAKF